MTLHDKRRRRCRIDRYGPAAGPGRMSAGSRPFDRWTPKTRDDRDDGERCNDGCDGDEDEPPCRGLLMHDDGSRRCRHGATNRAADGIIRGSLRRRRKGRAEKPREWHQYRAGLDIADLSHHRPTFRVPAVIAGLRHTLGSGHAHRHRRVPPTLGHSPPILADLLAYSAPRRSERVPRACASS